jgi:hypothetical protein
MKPKLTIPALLILSIIGFLGFSSKQESQKFYYAFGDKIGLDPVKNKLVIKFQNIQNKQIRESIKSKYGVDSALWQDSKTLFITTRDES